MRRHAVFGGLLAAVFIAGGALGVIGDRWSQRPVIRTRLTADVTEILDRLALDAGQRARAESILSRRAPRTEAVMVELAERLRAVADSVDAELRQILTPEQRTRLDSLRAGGPSFILKRKVPTSSGVAVDTVLRLPPDSIARGRR